jgi:phage terminase small subunit
LHLKREKTMPRQERSKKSTVTNMAETFKSAKEMPEPTEKLCKRELSYFHRAIRSREISTWSEHDLGIATQLAITQVMFFDASTAVKTQGRTVINDRGTPVANPETAAMNQLSMAVKALSAALGLSASQRGVAGSAQAGRNKAEQEARNIIDKAMAHDGLI